MFTKIRKAVANDVAQFLAIKEKLSIHHITNNHKTQSGFLLGTNADTYLHYIENDYCIVAEKNNEIVGFGIMLKNETIKNSELWQKRHLVNWAFDIAAIENEKICFFEQLAFLPNHAITTTRLLQTLIKTAFAEGHDYILTTTVQQPILNLAAIPFILKVGGKLIGTIAENYPNVGNIVSNIYLMERKEIVKIAERY